MSAQARDTILINGVRYFFFGSPMFDYWDTNRNKPKLLSFNTGLQRGFFASWEIHETKLYLIDFYGEHYSIRPKRGFVREKNYSLSDLFPDQQRVFADWYSGELQIPIGKQVGYSHSFIGTILETSTTISIQKGIVKDSGSFSL